MTLAAMSSIFAFLPTQIRTTIETVSSVSHSSSMTPAKRQATATAMWSRANP